MERGSDVRVDGWEGLVEAVTGEYTTTTSKACGHLKVSRSTFVSCVRPWLDRVRVAGRIEPRRDESRRMDWVRILRLQGFVDGDDRAYYSTAQFEALMRESAVVERRVRYVPFAALVDDAEAYGSGMEAERRRYEHALKEAREGRRLSAHVLSEMVSEHEQNMRRILENHADVGLITALEEADVPRNDRTPAPWVAAPSGEVDPASAELESLSTLRTWGAADESVYRWIHDRGRWRVTFRLPKPGGGSTRIVRYAEDPGMIHGADDNGGSHVPWGTPQGRRLLAQVDRVCRGA